jgi:hypothetical protein
MEEPASARLFDCFAHVSDPRSANARHRLFDIFVTLLLDSRVVELRMGYTDDISFHNP